MKFFFLFAALSLAVIDLAWGGQSGKITGTIIDGETGDTLQGVNILLEGTSIGTFTDQDGYYVILNIPPGTYTLKAAMIGYARQSVEQLMVSMDVTTQRNLSLSSSILAGEEVTVTAQTPIVQRDLTSSKQLVRGEDMNRMPVEDFADAIELQAGVIKDVDGKIHIRGGRASEVNYLIDGISVSDPFAGELSL